MSASAPVCVRLFCISATVGRPTHPQSAAAAPVPAAQTECAGCHSCAEPTTLSPCLRACPRHALSVGLPADLGPASVILDELEDLYVPVRFDHRTARRHGRHVRRVQHLPSLHTAEHPHPACTSCHSAESVREDLVKPGLKGAYHRRCLSCHREWDDETTCEVCHAKREGGRLGGTASTACDHARRAPIEFKELILFPTGFASGDVVPFHHRSHSQSYERDCTECHRQQRCTRCHVHEGDELHPMRSTTQSSLHDTCFACHDGTRCTACHGRSPTALFSHRDTGWPLKPYHASLALPVMPRALGPVPQAQHALPDLPRRRVRPCAFRPRGHRRYARRGAPGAGVRRLPH